MKKLKRLWRYLTWPEVDELMQAGMIFWEAAMRGAPVHGDVVITMKDGSRKYMYFMIGEKPREDK